MVEKDKPKSTIASEPFALLKPESCAPIATIIAAEARIVRIRIALLLSSSRLACCLMPSISHRNIMTPRSAM